jgi:hypothetical protein
MFWGEKQGKSIGQLDSPEKQQIFDLVVFRGSSKCQQNFFEILDISGLAVGNKFLFSIRYARMRKNFL